MDVSEKKRKLEAIRAAREAKQRMVEQCATALRAPAKDGPATSLSEAPSLSTANAVAPSLPAQRRPPPGGVATASSRSASRFGVVAAGGGSSRKRNNSAAAAGGHTPRTAGSGAASSSSSQPAQWTASPRGTEARALRTPSPSGNTRPPAPHPRDDPHKAPTAPAPAEPAHRQPAPWMPQPSLGSGPSSPHGPQRSPQPSPQPLGGRHRQGLDSLRSWRPLAAGAGAAGAATAGLTAHCVLSAKVVLRGEGRAAVGVAVSYLPYRSEPEEGSGGGDTVSEPSGVDMAVCVAAAYSAGSTNVGTSARGGDVVVDGAESGFAWGSGPHPAALRPGAHRSGSVVPLDTASRMARRAPGLALTWTVIPGSATHDGFAAQVVQRGGGAAVDGEADAVDAAALDATADLVVVTPLLCDVELSTLMAHPFRPGVFVGGTRTGRIVMWQAAAEWAHLGRRQLRARAMATTGSAGTLVWRPQRPCVSTFPSPASHQAPLLALAIHGDASSHCLYSVDQDGKICTWAAWQPTEPLAFRTAYLGSKSIGYTATAAAFVSQRGSDAMTKVFIGTVGGAVLEGFNRDSRVVELAYCGGVGPGPATAAVPSGGGDALESPLHAPGGSSPAVGCGAAPSLHHSRLVTAVAVQAQGDVVRECDCVVSASMDGSCVAWLGNAAHHRLDSFTAPVTALQWSPTCTSLFAAGDEEGLVMLWNIFRSTAAPIVSLSTRQLSMLQPGSSTAAAILAVGSSSSASGGGGDGAGSFDGSSLLNMAAAGDMGIVDPVEGASPAVTSLSFSDDGRWLFAGTAAGDVFAMELGQGLY